MTYQPTRLRLDHDETLVLYTDGLIEQRTGSIDLGLSALMDAAAEIPSGPAIELCDHILETLGSRPDTGDDRTVVALRCI